MELVININGRDVKVKDLLDVLNKIKLIVEGNCNYCKEHNIYSCNDKIKLIKKLLDDIYGS